MNNSMTMTEQQHEICSDPISVDPICPRPRPPDRVLQKATNSKNSNSKHSNSDNNDINGSMNIIAIEVT